MSNEGFPSHSVMKNLPANAGDAGDAGDVSLIPGSERSLEEETETHSSILAMKNSRGACWGIVHGVAKS